MSSKLVPAILVRVFLKLGMNGFRLGRIRRKVGDMAGGHLDLIAVAIAMLITPHNEASLLVDFFDLDGHLDA